MPDGSQLFLNGVPLIIGYQGGDVNDVVLRYNNVPMISGGDNYEVQLVGGRLQVFVDLNPIATLDVPLGEVSGLIIDGGAGSDTLPLQRR